MAEINVNFIRNFNTLKDAEEFAFVRNGRVVVRYDWDSFKQELVKLFVVEY